MIKYLMIIVVLGSLCSCWPTRVGFVDDSMPEEWKDFYVTPLELNAATAPANYNATLTESIRTGVQNNTRLKMLTETNDSAVQISGTVKSYNTTPQSLSTGEKTPIKKKKKKQKKTRTQREKSKKKRVFFFSGIFPRWEGLWGVVL